MGGIDTRPDLRAAAHRAPDGHPHVIRGAWTAVFRRMSGKWMIVTEHLSVPSS